MKIFSRLLILFFYIIIPADNEAATEKFAPSQHDENIGLLRQSSWQEYQLHQVIVKKRNTSFLKRKHKTKGTEVFSSSITQLKVDSYLYSNSYTLPATQHIVLAAEYVSAKRGPPAFL